MMTKLNLVKRWYAPWFYGYYQCSDCKCKLDNVEKRTWRCKECAIKAKEKEPIMTEQKQDIVESIMKQVEMYEELNWFITTHWVERIIQYYFSKYLVIDRKVVEGLIKKYTKRWNHPFAIYPIESICDDITEDLTDLLPTNTEWIN
jgi:DNA-directed RNA polymerase subunit RPC12/RpoP